MIWAFNWLYLQIIRVIESHQAPSSFHLHRKYRASFGLDCPSKRQDKPRVKQSRPHSSSMFKLLQPNWTQTKKQTENMLTVTHETKTSATTTITAATTTTNTGELLSLYACASASASEPFWRVCFEFEDKLTQKTNQPQRQPMSPTTNKLMQAKQPISPPAIVLDFQGKHT